MYSSEKNRDEKGRIDYDDSNFKYNKPGSSLELGNEGIIGKTQFGDYSVLSMSTRDWMLLAMVTFVAFFVRFFRISQPDSVVFDEVHFGGFASKYIKREYFFDVHPPLAKLIIAGVAAFNGFDGSFDFKEIGKEFVGNNVPYFAMRSVQALFGLLLIPTAYITSKVTGLTTETALFTSTMVAFENGLVTQSRYIFLDPPLILFTATSALAWLVFGNLEKKPFSRDWWISLSFTGLSLGLAISCKWVGLFVIALIGFSTVKQLWDMIGDLRITPSLFFRHFIARAICLIIIPVAVYMSFFQVQFMVLNKFSEAASSMSAEFQNTLEGNGLAPAKKDIIYGSTIVINHVATNGGYLHSHKSDYPAGSKQQQITLYPFRDSNNNWIVEKGHFPDRNETVVEGIEYVKHNDTIRLLHVTTGRRLHSHNVRPSFSDKDYINEASGYSFPDSNDNFRVEIIRGDSRDSESSTRLMSIYSRFRLVHIGTGCVLYSRPQKLPEWGFKQQEVICIRDGMKPRSEWVIESNESDKLKDSPMVHYSKPGFLSKFLELNQRMWTSNAELTSSHPYDSRPDSWPTLRRGIGFWGKAHAQVYLLGNPFVWYLSTLSIFSYIVVHIVASILEKRNIVLPLNTSRNQYFSVVGFFVSGWALHYFPFFLMKRQLFLHHYFPALYFAIMAFAATTDSLVRRFRPQVRFVFALVLSVISIYVFYKFSPLAYGVEWTKAGCNSAKWGADWDFECSRPRT